MDSSDWLRTQLASFECPACGQRYRRSRIRLLAERDGLYFVDLDCLRCATSTVAIVTVELTDDERAIADASDLARSSHRRPTKDRPPEPPPVSVDEVLEMHEFLAGFEGDITGLFEAAARSDGARRR